MRHLTGFLLAVVLSAALLFGAGWGIARIIALTGGHPLTVHSLTSLPGIEAVGAVVGTGLLLGLLLSAPRVSPLATGLPGLILLAWTGLMIAHSSYTLRYLPLPGSPETSGLVFLLKHAVLALIGSAMIIPMFVPSRWHGGLPYYEEEDDDEDFSVPAALGLVP